MECFGKQAEHGVNVRQRSVVLHSSGHREPLSFDIRHDGQSRSVIEDGIRRLCRTRCNCCRTSTQAEKVVAMDRYWCQSERWDAEDLRCTPAQCHKRQRLEQLGTLLSIRGATVQVSESGRFVQAHLDSDQRSVARDEIPVLGKQGPVAFGTSVLEQCLNCTE